MLATFTPYNCTMSHEQFYRLSAFGKTLAPPVEFVMHIHFQGRFFFFCSKDMDMEKYCEHNDFFIIDYTSFNSKYYIGHGLYYAEDICGRLFFNVNKRRAEEIDDMLYFIFEKEKPVSFLPTVSFFRHTFEAADCRCYALYDYVPLSRDVKRSVYLRKTTNLIFRFLCCMPHNMRYVA